MSYTVIFKCLAFDYGFSYGRSQHRIRSQCCLQSLRWGKLRYLIWCCWLAPSERRAFLIVCCSLSAQSIFQLFWLIWPPDTHNIQVLCSSKAIGLLSRRFVSLCIRNALAKWSVCYFRRIICIWSFAPQGSGLWGRCSFEFGKRIRFAKFVLLY